jgi:ParB family chromosome partitioning protein
MKTSFNEKRFSGFRFDPRNLTIIGLDTKDGAEHPLWDERVLLPLDESMVLSIMSLGVKEPIIVRKEGTAAQVVDGRRRVMHAREANKRLKKLGEPCIDVPAVVERGSEEHLSHVAIALNEIRRPDELLVKADKAARLVSRNGGDIKDAALAFGVTTVTIKNWLKLVELPSPIKKAVVAGVLSANAASKLHGLDRTEQLETLEKLKAVNAKTGKRATATQANGKKNGGRPKKTLHDKIEAVVKEAKKNNWDLAKFQDEAAGYFETAAE